MARKKDANWNVAYNEVGPAQSVDHAQLAVLMDIRDELKSLNALLHCGNFVRIPFKLDAIRAHTSRIRKPRAKVKA